MPSATTSLGSAIFNSLAPLSPLPRISYENEEARYCLRGQARIAFNGENGKRPKPTLAIHRSAVRDQSLFGDVHRCNRMSDAIDFISAGDGYLDKGPACSGIVVAHFADCSECQFAIRRGDAAV